MQKLDRFGKAPSLNFQGNITTQTKFGSVLTILLAVFMLTAAVLFCIPLFSRSNPSLVNYTLYYSPTNNLTINSGQQMFGFIVNGSLYINTTIYNCSMTTTTNSTPQLLPTTMYNSTDYNGLVYYIPEAMNIANQDVIVIFKLTDDSQVRYDFVGYSSVDILLIYDDIELDPMNYNTPISQIPLTSVFEDGGGTVQVSFKQINFTSDNGLLFSSKDAQTAIAIDSIQAGQGTADAYFTFTLAKGSSLMVYYRSYPKIQDVLAQLSGLLGALVLVLGFLPKIWSKWNSTQNLIDLTSFSSGDGPANNDDSASHIIPLNGSEISDQEEINTNGFFKKCQVFLTKPYKNIKRYQKLEKQIDEQFDVTYLLQKNYQHEALISIFFTPNERRLFQKMAVPILHSKMNEGEIEFDRNPWWETDETEGPSLDLLIGQLMSKKEKTENEKKLLQIYVKNFKPKRE